LFYVSYSDHCKVDLPAGHRFPMLKYELIREQLLRLGILNSTQLYRPEPIPTEMILAVHAEDWWNRVQKLALTPQEERRLGFPMTQQLLARCHSSVSGTWFSALNALRDGVGMSIAGGTHHAYAGHGEGFCLLNDVAIAAQCLLDSQLARRILVIDLDVHQGNGTAVIFEKEDRVFTFSMHGEKNYPLKKESSNCDVALSTGMGDVEYNRILANVFASCMQKHKPDFIFYIAGSDVLATDRLGKLALSLDGCARRDQLVIETCHTLSIPFVVVLGGGYSDRYHEVLQAHVQTFARVADLFG